ncbi:MAG: M14 family zinc carboxypeptidase, partial [Acidobacteriota bacterium]
MNSQRRFKTLAAVFIFFIIAFSLQEYVYTQEEDYLLNPPLLLRVTILDKEREIPLLAGYQLDVAGINVKENTVDIIGDYPTYLNLIAGGFTTEIVRDLTPTTEEILGLSDYLNPDEIEQKLNEYEAAYPALAKKFQYGTTEEGRPAWAMKISDNVTVEEDEAAALFVAQHHAREVMTPEIAMDIIDYLLTRYSTDQEVKYWVDNREIWVLPTHNPDGSNYVFTIDNMWRKNRRNNGDGTYGVDLNRNYPFKWGGCNGSSGSTGSDTYRGPSPASEPETQGIMNLTQDHRPLVNLSYHSYSELVIHPFGCTNVYPSPHEKKVFREISSDMGARLFNDAGTGYYANGTGWELLYAVDGEMNDWFYGEMGSYGVTIEVNQSFQPDYETWRDSTVFRNRAGWQYLLNRMDDSSIYGHTYDACAGSPISANLSLDEVVFSFGESTRTSEPQHGRYQWITQPDKFHINFWKEGYYSQKWPVNIRFASVLKDAYLVPEGSFDLDYYAHRILDSDQDNDGEADPGETVDMPVTIYATGGDVGAITATLSSSDPNVSILDSSATFPDIPAGGTAESLSNHFKIYVSSEALDGHEIPFTLTFTSNKTLCRSETSFMVRVTKGFESCPFAAEYLESDPGWTIENSDSLGWEFGPPAGASGGPPSAHTGTNVYGTNLDGNYGNNADYKLTTLAYDLRGLRNAELRFWRWLNNEEGADLASIEISTNGVDFQEIWKGFGRDTQWEEYRYDVSSIADQEDLVYIRFRLKSDSYSSKSGFYIDDVTICGEEVPSSAGKVKYYSHTINDSNSSYGNGDGEIDIGETVTMAVTVRNTKDSTATAVSGILTTTSTGVTINNNYATYPDIAAGVTAESDSPHYTFTV